MLSHGANICTGREVIAVNCLLSRRTQSSTGGRGPSLRPGGTVTTAPPNSIQMTRNHPTAGPAGMGARRRPRAGGVVLSACWGQSCASRSVHAARLPGNKWLTDRRTGRGPDTRGSQVTSSRKMADGACCPNAELSNKEREFGKLLSATVSWAGSLRSQAWLMWSMSA